MTQRIVSDSVLVFGPLKEPALYFERVLPISPIRQLRSRNEDRDDAEDFLPDEALDPTSSFMPSLIGVTEVNKDAAGLVLGSILGALLAASFHNNEKLSQVLDEKDDDHLLHSFRHAGITVDAVDLALGEGIDAYMRFAGMLFETYVKPAIQNLGFATSPVWRAAGTDEFRDGDSQNGVFASIKSLNLIDTKKLSWEKIIEFRKDQRSRKALRDLRLFLNSNFDGIEGLEITDRLRVLIDDYDTTVKRWGFETARKSLSVVSTKENGLLAGGSLLAIAAGGPAAFAGIAGMLVELAKVGLEVGHTVIEAKDQISKNPVRYLSNVRDLAG